MDGENISFPVINNYRPLIQLRYNGANYLLHYYFQLYLNSDKDYYCENGKLLKLFEDNDYELVGKWEKLIEKEKSNEWNKNAYLKKF